MPKGVIKKMMTDKGFGFIAREGSKDLFFHHSAVADRGFDDLREGDEVEYTEGEGPKGPAAESVRPCGE